MGKCLCSKNVGWKIQVKDFPSYAKIGRVRSQWGIHRNSSKGLRGTKGNDVEMVFTLVSASEALCGPWKKRTVVLEVTLLEIPSSARLLETEQTLRGGGRGRRAEMCVCVCGGGQHLPLHWKCEWAWWAGAGQPWAQGCCSGRCRSLVPSFHPLWQPAEAAVTVQRVGSQCPRRQSRNQGPLPRTGP